MTGLACVRKEPYSGPAGRCEYCWKVHGRRTPGTTVVIFDHDPHEGRWTLACDTHAAVYEVAAEPPQR